MMIRVNGEERTVVTVNSTTSLTVDAAFSATHTNLPPYVLLPASDHDVDDFQVTQAATHFTGAGRTNCNVTMLTDATDELTPDAGLNAAWTDIRQDEQTGMYFTNTLSTTADWAAAHDICDGLNGGTGGDGWR